MSETTSLNYRKNYLYALIHLNLIVKQVNLKIFLYTTILLTGIFFHSTNEASQQQGFHDKAFNFFIEGKINEAIQTYLQALKLKPDSAETHHYLGVLYFQIGSGAKAINHFKQAESFYKNRKDKNSKFNLDVIRNNLEMAYEKLGLNPEDFRTDVLIPVEHGWKSSGVGFFIGKQGNLLTTASSIAGADKIRVRFPNNQTEPVILIREFIVYKIAILQLSNPEKYLLNSLEFENNPHFEEGETVYAMDFSKLHSLNPSMSKGKILKENALENSNKIVQLDLAVKEGQDGGPLFNELGNVIGLILGKSMAQKSFTYLKDAPGHVSFAIKSSYLKRIIPVSTDKKNQNKGVVTSSDLNSGVNIKSVSSEAINNFVVLEIFK